MLAGLCPGTGALLRAALFKLTSRNDAVEKLPALWKARGIYAASTWNMVWCSVTVGRALLKRAEAGASFAPQAFLNFMSGQAAETHPTEDQGKPPIAPG
jgi:hypothetical protein